MTKASMGKELGCTKQAILNMIDRLVSGGFLLKNEETKYLHTTQKWQNVYVFNDGKETLPEVKKLFRDGKETLPEAGKETLPNNNTIDKNRIESSEAVSFVSLLGSSFKVFSEAGLKGVFFEKVKKLHSLSDVEVNRLYAGWKVKMEALDTDFKTKDHLKNSFNRFISESKNSSGRAIGTQDTVTRARAGRVIG
jgi:hypothetical protein